jgi:dephospho-CoA kinase
VKRPRVFGLTGSIGSGKSTVARLLEERGVPVVSADALAREVVLPGAPALEELAEAFGPRILQPDGTLDRAQLGALTLGHPERRALLNSILHPKIRQGAERAFGALGEEGHDLAAYDIPLLFETGQEERLRPVVVVSAPEPKRLERVLLRDGTDHLDFYRKQGAQLPLEEKLARADFVLENSGSLEELAAQIEPLIAKVRAFLRL